MTLAARVDRLRRFLGAALRGRPEAVDRAAVCMLASGHLLIEDVPGVGKTTLARAMAGAFDLSFRRIQFTSDLLPADIVGASVLEPGTGHFSFRPGPIFANIVLADELNRATPRTQSALLEAMSEGQVSTDEGSHPLPRPFLVVATQNPIEHHGTFPLPESQLDRFLMRIEIGYPDSGAERALVLGQSQASMSQEPASVTELLELQACTAAVSIDDALGDYMFRLAHTTRQDPAIELGVSTRGLLALKQAAQGFAILAGRDYMVPDDIQAAAIPVLAHRILLKRADAPMRERALTIQRLLERVEVPV